MKSGSIAKKSSTVKQVSAKAGVAIKATTASNASTYATLKQNVVVLDYGTVDNTWSFVQDGNVTGYVLTKSL